MFDFETTGVPPKGGINPSTCEPVQLAAVAMNPRTLEFTEADTFKSFIKPDTPFEELDKENINWHCDVRNCTVEELQELWETAPSVKTVWEDFVSFVSSYNPSKRFNSMPIAAGYNIKAFDMVIVQRLCERFGPVDSEKKQKVFYGRNQLDLMDFVFLWTENLNEPKNQKLDTIRQWFGLSGDGAHDALEDVKDTARILSRFLNLHRRYASKVKFKDSMKGL